jgi:hypothetical protein
MSQSRNIYNLIDTAALTFANKKSPPGTIIPYFNNCPSRKYQGHGLQIE